jgi:hypothetical protein
MGSKNRIRRIEIKNNQIKKSKEKLAVKKINHPIDKRTKTKRFIIRVGVLFGVRLKMKDIFKYSPLIK